MTLDSDCNYYGTLSSRLKDIYNNKSAYPVSVNMHIGTAARIKTEAEEELAKELSFLREKVKVSDSRLPPVRLVVDNTIPLGKIFAIFENNTSRDLLV